MTTILALRTRCTKATNAKAPTQHVPERGEHNSNLANLRPKLTWSSWMFWATWFHDVRAEEGGDPAK